MAKLKIVKGNFVWKDEAQKEVIFKENENGRFFVIEINQQAQFV